MRHPGPWDADSSRAYGNGPLALPGTYTLELKAGAEVLTTSRARKLAYAMEQKIKPLRDRLAKKPGKKLQARLEALTGDYYRLRTPEGNYMRPQLIDQLQYLYMMLSRADQQPGQDAYKRFEELQELLEDLENSWKNKK